MRDVLELQNINIQRCVKPRGFSVHKAEFHHFYDANLLGYGVCSYLRLVSPKGEVHVSLMLGKSRVTPIKPVTISVVVAVKEAITLSEEFTYENAEHFFLDR